VAIVEAPASQSNREQCPAADSPVLKKYLAAAA
jgi:hypothetical protein